MKIYYDKSTDEICLHLGSSSMGSFFKRFIYSEKPLKIIQVSRFGMKDLVLIGRLDEI
jgi:hypothetical protein